MSIWKKYGFAWITGALFVLSLVGHWYFGWQIYKTEQYEKGSKVEMGDYFRQMSRDTLENWQSEFLQLAWQVAGLSFLFFIGSPQSKENSERQEEKIDELLKLVNKKEAESIIKKLDKKYQRK